MAKKEANFEEEFLQISNFDRTYKKIWDPASRHRHFRFTIARCSSDASLPRLSTVIPFFQGTQWYVFKIYKYICTYTYIHLFVYIRYIVYDIYTDTCIYVGACTENALSYASSTSMKKVSHAYTRLRIICFFFLSSLLYYSISLYVVLGFGYLKSMLLTRFRSVALGYFCHFLLFCFFFLSFSYFLVGMRRLIFIEGGRNACTSSRPALLLASSSFNSLRSVGSFRSFFKFEGRRGTRVPRTRWSTPLFLSFILLDAF